MKTDKQERPCANCGSHITKQHCATTGCQWVRCTTCKRVSDPNGNHMPSSR